MKYITSYIYNALLHAGFKHLSNSFIDRYKTITYYKYKTC
jgi:hypothetical protein